LNLILGCLVFVWLIANGLGYSRILVAKEWRGMGYPLERKTE
jgi:hypothetical protein